MREIPILFSAPMVRAVLAGQKTQTRCIIKLPTKTHSGRAIYERPDMGGWEPTTVGGSGCFTIGTRGEAVPEPEMAAIWHRTCGVTMAARWQIGDRLWVREAWRAGIGYDGAKIADMNPGVTRIWYDADGQSDGAGSKGRPSIHMPRWASRIMLTVTSVRVERLQDISDADAIAEGVPEEIDGSIGDEIYCRNCGGHGTHGALGANLGVIEVDCLECDTATKRYRNLWTRINGPGSWDANPWVWVIEFQRETRP